MLLLASTLACSGPSTLDSAEQLAEPSGSRSVAAGPSDYPELGLDALIDLALAEPGQTTAIAEHLRERFGEPALDHLLARYHSELATKDFGTPEDLAVRGLIDQVAQQRDAHFGGLYWHRDLAQAQAIARAEGKPVLSLRLLGELTSEFSCANSRLFRTILYADPELASWLEREFVLHWSSERPVPKVEIDFGDGRKLTRTITGNSAHFVLDAEGRTIDVLPGLWAPQQLRAALSESVALHDRLARTPAGEWAEALAQHHDQRFEQALARLGDELGRLRGGSPDPRALRGSLLAAPGTGAPVPAIRAVPMAIGKSKIEAPILNAAPRELGGLGPSAAPLFGSPALPDELERMMIGARLTGPIVLHPNTRSIIASERPVDPLVPASERAHALATLEQTLATSLQLDTAKNALELYPRIHAELARRARGEQALDFASVDEWIYAKLFETPASDPWLGLVDPTVYTGLVDGGVVRAPRKGD